MTSDHILQTPCGAVLGKPAQPGVTAYRGIRYADAGRWEYPKTVTHWDGLYDASHFGPNAMQGGKPSKSDGAPSFYEHEFRLGLPYTFSEDCQYLNIYAPDDAKNAPVIVYIHGGAYMGGSGWDKVFNEPVWPEHGVIAVTLNYRLGLFGAVALPELEEESGHAGNYQMYDQIAALQWIHSNITAFGGDPDNITLMGQSAGARSVQMLTGSPKMKGIIRRAVMSSGGGVPSRLFDTQPTMKENLAFWQEWKRLLGAADLSSLRKMSSQQILDSTGMLMSRFGFQKVISHISPVYDNAAFPVPGSDPELPDGWLRIPFLCGGNMDDMVPGLADDAHRWAASRPEASYSYCFSRHLPGDNSGSFHSADLWYWFGTLSHCWRPFTEKDYALRDTMVGYLMNFARTGNPNGPGLPLWQAADDSNRLMQLDETCEMAPVPDPAAQKGIML